MKAVKFKGGLNSQFKQGTLGMSVHSGISYKRPKKPPTRWEKFKSWLKELFNK